MLCLHTKGGLPDESGCCTQKTALIERLQYSEQYVSTVRSEIKECETARPSVAEAVKSDQEKAAFEKAHERLDYLTCLIGTAVEVMERYRKELTDFEAVETLVNPKFDWWERRLRELGYTGSALP